MAGLHFSNLLAAGKRKLEDKCDNLKKDIDTLEGTLRKAEEDKKAKDGTIKQLNDELARQDEVLLKTQNAKKQVWPWSRSAPQINI